MNVPAQHLFVGRRDELDELEAALLAPGGVVVAAVHGLGGIGKSTLAARYAAGRGGRWNPVWWITADAPQAVQAGLAALATALQPALGTVLALEEMAGWALEWLGCHSGWLLVLDNVTDPADIAAVMDRAAGGRVLVTSRLGQGWHRFGAQVVRLEVLTEDQAVDLLTRIATGVDTGVRAGLEGARELVGELGCLPLAVEQAAAFLHQNQMSARAYLDLLATSPARVYDQAAAGGQSGRTIARIWQITLGALARDAPLAGPILRILAWYAPQDVPRTLLEAIPAATAPPAAPRQRPVWRPGWRGRGLRWPRRRSRRLPAVPLADPADLQRALGALAAFNMITLDGETITVHRLVQALARTPDPADPHRQAADIDHARATATALLDQARPADALDPAGWPAWRLLLPHIDALAEHAPPGTDTATTSLLLNRTAAFLHNQGSEARAIYYFHRALVGRQRVLGEQHPYTLTSRNNLAGAYESVGDLGRAIPLFEQTLTDTERVLGEQHPYTLTSRNNLAYAYESVGDLGRAIPLFEQTLTDTERVLGEQHPDTLTSRNNLAYAYRAAGDLGRAIPLYEQTLTDRQRVLGEQHPDTLRSRNNLAYAYVSAGDLGRAIPLFEQTLTDTERVLGEQHPDTLTSRNNLAYAYESAGDLGRAIPLYEQTLTDRQRVLGEQHPDTLRSRNNLAGAYESVGDLGRAIALFEQTLTDTERVLGEQHPDTLRSRNNLAYAYESVGDLGRAIPLYEQTLTDRQRVLGEQHPDTLRSRNNLAYAYESVGDLGRAIPLYEQTLTDTERVLGAEHPTTRVVRGNLEAARRENSSQ
ncbi:tetratricopeptide repeat protein [Actinomadura graeca]|uniref:tetratricopeptide repeat protein n=1 Tax=Actinomadura graeca TaxID=2750812 RepID=UPI00235A1D1E|nr:tetratricopeptide repeat protein [Actinomadura graeca]